jgi:16S rRNA (cytidine1402-2'-O)-methyltransferase
VKTQDLIQQLAVMDLALVSDAGTPGINDPGYELVQAAALVGYPVVPVPGPSSPIAALVVSGLPADTFLYLGYLPRKASQRQAFIKELADVPHTLIIFETPHRLMSALDDLLVYLGDRRAAAARESTKKFEQVLRGDLQSIKTHFEKFPPQGEFVLIVDGKHTTEENLWTEKELRNEIKSEKGSGETPRQLSRRLSSESGWSARKIYDLILQMNNRKSTE